MPSGSGSAAQEFTPDKEAPDLIGSGSDVIELGVSHEPLDRPLSGIAGTSKGLDGFKAYLDGIFRGQQDRTCSIITGCLALVAGAGNGIDVGPALCS